MESKTLTHLSKVKRMKLNSIRADNRRRKKRLASFYGTNVDAIFTYAHALESNDPVLCPFR